MQQHFNPVDSHECSPALLEKNGGHKTCAKCHTSPIFQILWPPRAIHNFNSKDGGSPNPNQTDMLKTHLHKKWGNYLYWSSYQNELTIIQYESLGTQLTLLFNISEHDNYFLLIFCKVSVIWFPNGNICGVVTVFNYEHNKGRIWKDSCIFYAMCTIFFSNFSMFHALSSR